MGFDDRLADRQAQADARRRRFGVTPAEFFEKRPLLARGQPRALVPNFHAQLLGLNRSRDADGGAGRRVLGGVFQQIDQHALHQHAVALAQR